MASPVNVLEDKERRCAWVLYVLLLGAFFGYVVYTIVDGIAQREDPPTSFEREQLVWNLPHIIAEGVRPTIGECTFSLDTDADDATARECNVEFYEDEESQDSEGVLVFFLGDFDIEPMRNAYEEERGEDDPEFDQTFIEGFVVLGFEEVGELWEAPIGLCSALEFPSADERDYETILDACPINTYVPVGAIHEAADSQAFASNFVLEAELFRTLDGEEEYSYSSSVSSTIWSVPAGELDDAFVALSADSDTSALAKSPPRSPAAHARGSHPRGRAKRTPLPKRSMSSEGAELQQASDALGYVGQVWVYQQGWTISVTEEVDPLDVPALFGLWGGAFTYVAIVFGLIFTAGKGGVRYNRFSKASKEKYQVKPASQRGKGKKKNKKKNEKEQDEDESEEDKDGDESMGDIDV